MDNILNPLPQIMSRDGVVPVGETLRLTVSAGTAFYAIYILNEDETATSCDVRLDSAPPFVCESGTTVEFEQLTTPFSQIQIINKGTQPLKFSLQVAYLSKVRNNSGSAGTSGLVSQERRERIAADENLQNQINGLTWQDVYNRDQPSASENRVEISRDINLIIGAIEPTNYLLSSALSLGNGTMGLEGAGLEFDFYNGNIINICSFGATRQGAAITSTGYNGSTPIYQNGFVAGIGNNLIFGNTSVANNLTYEAEPSYTNDNVIPPLKKVNALISAALTTPATDTAYGVVKYWTNEIIEASTASGRVCHNAAGQMLIPAATTTQAGVLLLGTAVAQPVDAGLVGMTISGAAAVRFASTTVGGVVKIANNLEDPRTIAVPTAAQVKAVIAASFKAPDWINKVAITMTVDPVTPNIRSYSVPNYGYIAGRFTGVYEGGELWLKIGGVSLGESYIDGRNDTVGTVYAAVSAGDVVTLEGNFDGNYQLFFIPAKNI